MGFWTIGVGLLCILHLVSPCALPFWMVRNLQLANVFPSQSSNYYSNDYFYNNEYSYNQVNAPGGREGGNQNQRELPFNQANLPRHEYYQDDFFNQQNNPGAWIYQKEFFNRPRQPNEPRFGGFHKELAVNQPNSYVHIKEYSEWTWWEVDPSGKSNGPGNKGGDSGLKGKTTEPKAASTEPKVASTVPQTAAPTTTTAATTTTTVAVEETSTTTTTQTTEAATREVEETSSEVVGETVAETTREVAEPTTERTGTTVDSVRPRRPSGEVEETSNSVEAEVGDTPQRVGELQVLDLNSTKECKIGGSDITSLRTMLEELLSFPRDLTDENLKEKARDSIISKFKEFGLQVWTQNFTMPEYYEQQGFGPYGQRTGVNIVGVLPGDNRGKLDDGILVVGAHYDTVQSSNGVDDNGSGVAVMMETARVMAKAQCRYNNTIMFVAFDMEEHGAIGSNYFVSEYLIPEELNKARAHFQGAFILDSVMNFNNSFNSQVLPKDFQQSLPDLDNFISHTGNRGDFLAMISRNSVDNHLAKRLLETWRALDHNEFKLYNLAVNMGPNMPPAQILTSHPNFLSSDHATFWYHNFTQFPETLNAVLLTDTGPFRGRMRECYHTKCDDLTAMSSEKLQFSKKTTDALTATLAELSYATAKGSVPAILSICLQVLASTFVVHFSHFNFH